MYNGPYLRVLTPRTTNGNNVLLDERGMLQYREVHLPMSAKAHIELLNRSTPAHLKKKIEVVQGFTQKEQNDEQAQTIENLKAELAALKAAQLSQKPADPITSLGANSGPSNGPNMTKEQAMQQQPQPQPKPTKPSVPNNNPQNQ